MQNKAGSLAASPSWHQYSFRASLIRFTFPLTGIHLLMNMLGEADTCSQHA
jgi:hypothetical protein